MTLFALDLFATEQLDPGSATLAIGGWVGGVVSVVGTILSAYFGYRVTRDKLTLDAEKLKMSARIEVLEAVVSRSEADCQRRLEVVQQQVVTLRLELTVEQGRTRALADQLQHEVSRRRQTVGALSGRVDQLDPSKSQGGTGTSADGICG